MITTDPKDPNIKVVDPVTGLQKAHLVLSEEERAKGFVRPVRRTYIHTCGVATTMGMALSETYARNPDFYTGTYCTGCGKYFPVEQFKWDDGHVLGS